MLSFEVLKSVWCSVVLTDMLSGGGHKRRLPHSGGLSREKTFSFQYKMRISRRKLSGCSVPIIMWVWPQNLRGNLSRVVLKHAKNAKVFFLESVPLYDSSLTNV